MLILSSLKDRAVGLALFYPMNKFAKSSDKTQSPVSVGESPQPASLARIFATFFKIGAFTFGGGWAMIAIIEREIVHRYHWLRKEEFLDLLSVVQALPGILAVNISVAVGDRLKGTRGSIVGALGTILPSFCMILFIAIFLTPEAINGNPTLVRIFKGIRPAVVALIIAPVISSAKTAKIGLKTLWIPVVVALAVWSHLPVISNPVVWIIAGGVGGIYVLKKSMDRAGEGKLK